MLKGKAGLAALGYLAYRAYRDNQGSRGPGATPGSSGGAGSSDGGSSGGSQSIGAQIGEVIDRFTGGGAGRSGSGGDLAGRSGGDLGRRSGGDLAGRSGGSGDLAWRSGGSADPMAGPVPEPIPELAVSDGRALLLIRAMIAAAQADGEITPDERARIVGQLDAADADSDDRRLLERELADPKPLDALLREVRDRDTAQQFYLASRAAVDGSAPTQKAYLDYLRQRLGLGDDEVQAAESLTT